MRRALPIIAVALAGAAGCGERETVDGPVVAVELYVSPTRAVELVGDGPSDCFARCPGSGALPPVDLVPRAPCGELVAPCALRSAEDRIRITAWYDGLDLARQPPETTFALMLDGVVDDVQAPVTRWRDGHHEAHVTVLDLPALDVAEVGVRASNTLDYSAVAGPWPVVRAKIDATVSGCDGACTAGVGVAVVEVEVPPRFATPIQLVTRLVDPDTGAGADIDQGPIDVALDDAGRLVGSRAIAIPDAPGGTWSLWTVAADVRTLVARLDLAAAPIDIEVLDCAEMDRCALPPGASVDVRIAGPAGLHADTAALIGIVDGVVEGDPAVVPLARIGDERVAVVRRVVPEGSTWQVVARIGQTEVRSPEIAIAP